MAAISSLPGTGDKSWAAFVTCAVWAGYSVLAPRADALTALVHVPLVCAAAYLACRHSYGIWSPGHRRLAADGSNRSLLARAGRVGGVASPRAAPRYTLVANPVTVFGEKVRWIMDLLDVDYEERDLNAGVAALLRRRSIPWLVDAVGDARINNSTEIVCYLSAVHVPTMAAASRARAEAFLLRTPVALRWEEKLQAMGRDAVGWVYSYIHNPANGFPSSTIKLLWGASEPCVPWLDRLLFRAAWPFLFKWAAVLAFDCSPEAQKVRMGRLRGVLDDVDAALAGSGGRYILGASPTYIDVDFAAMWAPWMPATTMSTAPAKFANGRFRSFERLLDAVPWPAELASFEQEMLARPCGKLVERMYSELRGARL